MAKGSVRKKGDMYYYRYYVEDEATGKRKQVERKGTTSKRETEALMRKAIEDYEATKIVSKVGSTTVGDLLDKWVDEYLIPSSLSNGTVDSYQDKVSVIKRHPIAQRKLQTVTAQHLQQYVDSLCYGYTDKDGTVVPPKSKGGMYAYSAVLRGAFRYAVVKARLISHNPMDYVEFRFPQDKPDIFAEDEEVEMSSTISHEKFLEFVDYLRKHNPPALLPVQIAYYTGCRIGEACSLSWTDINLDEQYFTVRRSVKYDTRRRATEIDTPKRAKTRIVDYCDTLASILRKAKTEQARNKLEYGPFYRQNYYQAVKVKNRTYYDLYALPCSEEAPDDYKPIAFVCLRPDGSLERPDTLAYACRSARKHIDGLEAFHFHLFRHTYATNMLDSGASVKDVQEALGHGSSKTTQRYTHGNRDRRRTVSCNIDKYLSEAK